MHIVSNGEGISGLGNNMVRVLNSSIVRNRGRGVVCSRSCHVEGSIISENDGVGVTMGSGTVLGNTITANESFGIALDPGGAGIGFGNNTLTGNNNNEAQVSDGVVPLQPNVCVPACP